MAETIRETHRPAKSSGHMDAHFHPAINRLAECECPMLIVGEYGVGKRFTAEMIHSRSSRARNLFKEYRCAELDEHVIISALSLRGTVYFAEVAELSLPLQDLLIRAYFLSSVAKKCRLLFGSSRDLHEEVKATRMREDFFYFISTITLQIPPLRHRKSEMLSIADMLLSQYARQFDRPRPVLCEEIIGYLMEHSWPDNLIEFQTAIKTLVAIGDQSISLAALKAATPSMRGDGHRKSRSLKEATRSASIEIERQMIAEVLGSTGGNRKRAADELGISYKALLYKIKRFGFEPQVAFKETGVA